MMSDKKSFIAAKSIIKTTGNWMIWYISILVFIQIIFGIILVAFGYEKSGMPFLDGETSWTIIHTVSNSANIYFLVTGILSLGTLLKYYISNGVTRRDFFRATIISMFTLTIGLTLIVSMLYGIETIIYSMNGWIRDVSVNFMYFVKMAVELSIYFLIGMFISAGFYRLGVLLGVGICFLSVPIMIIYSVVWGEVVDLPLLGVLQFGGIHFAFALLGSLAILVILCYFIRSLTKNIPVKA
ncbi:hypothetical protein [Cytobacillus horneckiae]|uniref:hypothetical protein n=1 Tax=Cytobacillus horneckiae TaxID=549687 RepID=UPI003D9A732E